MSKERRKNAYFCRFFIFNELLMEK